MSKSPDIAYTSPVPEQYREFIRRDVHPQLDPARLSTRFLVGEERGGMGLRIAGDWSLVLGYRRTAQPESQPRLAQYASAETKGTDLVVVQFQGVPGKAGYRVNQGLNTVNFFATQISDIAENPDNPYDRITMSPNDIDGVAGISSFATAGRVSEKYARLAASLGLQPSHEENIYVRDVSPKKPR